VNHAYAIRTKAPERYVLNEMNPEEMEEFEIHYFDCPPCAADVKAGQSLVRSLKSYYTTESDENSVINSAFPELLAKLTARGVLVTAIIVIVWFSASGYYS
jgi:hypothetical protein